MTSESPVRLSVSGLGKSYAISEPQTTSRRRWRTRKRTFEALSDVSFDVTAGETVAFVGRNGAGKSTLMKIISRITPPSAGEVVLRGRVGSLLEVGSGFNPDLTGRENVWLNGRILGMSGSEIGRRFDEIVSFADVGELLDTPVKRYSSGMYVRLAFAVAAHLRSDVLLVDEVLSVGDARFQRLCLDRMEFLAREEGRTILFVSHDDSAVRHLCTRALLLDRGRLVADSATEEVLRSYAQSTELSHAHQVLAEAHLVGSSENGDVVRVELSVVLPHDVVGLRLRLRSGSQVLAAAHAAHLSLLPGSSQLLCEIGPVTLIGDCDVDVEVVRATGTDLVRGVCAWPSSPSLQRERAGGAHVVVPSRWSVR